MGGYGAPLVFGGVWTSSTALLAGIAAFKRIYESLGDGDGRDGAGDGLVITNL
jgi:hypothetical protein